MIHTRALPSAANLRRLAFFVFLPGLLPLLFTLLHTPAAAQGDNAGESWCATSGQNAIPQEECLALEALYNGTNGRSWTDGSGWLESTAVCKEWRGVECSEGRVSRLALVANNLRGPLPDEIGDLAGLTHLDLTANRLNGPIPASIGRLSALVDLALGGNMLEETIPPEIGRLDALAALDLGDNQLGGPIPAELGALPGLAEMLYLDGNRLEGAIPAALCRLSPALASLDYNQLDYFATDEACDAAFPRWQLTQTTGPAGVSVQPLHVESGIGETAVSGEVIVRWLPVSYGGAGGYEAFTRHLATGELQSRAQIEDKTADSLQITLSDDPNAYSYFIRAWTAAHDNNQNRLAGDSEEVRIQAMPLSLPPIPPDDPLLYLPALALIALLLIIAIAVPVLKGKR